MYAKLIYFDCNIVNVKKLVKVQMYTKFRNYVKF